MMPQSVAREPVGHRNKALPARSQVAIKAIANEVRVGREWDSYPRGSRIYALGVRKGDGIFSDRQTAEKIPVPFSLQVGASTMRRYSRVRLLLNRRDTTHKAPPPVVINKRVAGSGTCVTEKFASVNVGSTPG